MVMKYLKLLELPLEIDHYLVRGLDYYVKTVFEIQPQGEGGAQSALGGGGRYDDLIEQLGGKPTPGVGFAAGLERIVLNLKRQNIAIPVPSQPHVFIAYLGEEAKNRAIEYSSRLRREGVGAILTPSGRSLKAQLKQANTLGASYALIIGEEEIKGGAVTLRDMASGEQQQVSFDDALLSLKRERINRGNYAGKAGIRRETL
jgi:histidyl-tRNA synthetase